MKREQINRSINNSSIFSVVSFKCEQSFVNVFLWTNVCDCFFEVIIAQNQILYLTQHHLADYVEYERFVNSTCHTCHICIIFFIRHFFFIHKRTNSLTIVHIMFTKKNSKPKNRKEVFFTITRIDKFLLSY